MNRGMKESGSERTKKKEKKCNQDPASNEKRKEGKRKRKKQKKKKGWKRKKSTKVGIHIPHPPALEYKKKKFFLD